MLKRIFSIKFEENILHINIVGIRFKHNINCNNKIYVIDKNSIKKQVRKIKNLDIKFKGSNSTVLIREPAPKFLNSAIILKNNCNVEIGTTKYKINNLDILISKDNCNVIIGNDLSVKNHLEILCNSESHKNVKIGNNCMFGSNVMLRTGDVHAIHDAENNILNYGNDVIIKDNVWLGYGVTVLKGVTIEQGCVIGTHSLVTKNCDTPHSIYAGTPAVLKKSNIFWSRKGIDDFEKDIKNSDKNRGF